MKTPKLIGAVAASLLLAGGAMAQQGTSLGEKADRVFDKMEAGTQKLWNRATGRPEDAGKASAADPDVRTDPSRRDPTTAMGAAPRYDLSYEAETARRERIDEAYRNWRARNR